jgi:hypothetical protein
MPSAFRNEKVKFLRLAVTGERVGLPFSGRSIRA